MRLLDSFLNSDKIWCPVCLMQNHNKRHHMKLGLINFPFTWLQYSRQKLSKHYRKNCVQLRNWVSKALKRPDSSCKGALNNVIKYLQNSYEFFMTSSLGIAVVLRNTWQRGYKKKCMTTRLYEREARVAIGVLLLFEHWAGNILLQLFF